MSTEPLASYTPSARSVAHEPDPAEVFPDDPRALPEGCEVDGARAMRPAHDVADFVILGSGASGATAARVLTTQGHSVILIEEGPWIRTREFTVDLWPSMSRMFRGHGTAALTGRSILSLMQGACVGGSTTINSAIAWRPPEDVLDRWADEFALGDEFRLRAFDAQFDALERELSVRAVADDALGETNAAFGVAARNRGYEAHRIQRYDSGCKGSAGCLTGCRHGRKMSMNITYVPQALRAGAKIYHSTRAERVETRAGRAVAVLCAMKGPSGPMPLRVHARRGVLVAASTIATPNVLRRTGLRSREIGKHLQAHPGVSMAGLFDRPMTMDYGAAQGFNSLHFLKEDHIKLETILLPPELAIARLPGVGPKLLQRIADYERLATWAVVIRAEAEGEVAPELFGFERVRFTPTKRDMERARKGLKILAEMMFDLGAREVYPGAHGVAPVLKRDDLHKWDDAPLDPRAYTMMASHLFGAARMSPDPRAGVVNTDFETHELRGLYVIDSSVFPTNLGVNPQHTIMALARRAAERLGEKPLPAV